MKTSLHKHDLVDTTEMYLRTILELEEEGVPPLRARIAERLHQSGPTVSQTVARMERDGLLTVENDRHLVLTADGRATAVSVMRKHRLAELLNKPTRSPYGNPIPGLEALGILEGAEQADSGERNLAFPGLTGSVVVQRICESVQTNADVLRQLHEAGIDPGTTVTVAQERDGVTIDRLGDKIRLPREVASRVFVAAH